ncbi:hypothetical protein [Nonomuraea insulae]|uniref:Uncharacterized protein n=1 Tax=Nonomuraea insulae TaxID=1616787 RepID=A0ABW1CRT6_9ACTN
MDAVAVSGGLQGECFADGEPALREVGRGRSGGSFQGGDRGDPGGDGQGRVRAGEVFVQVTQAGGDGRTGGVVLGQAVGQEPRSAADVTQRRHGRTLAEQGDQRLQGVLGAGGEGDPLPGGERSEPRVAFRPVRDRPVQVGARAPEVGGVVGHEQLDDFDGLVGGGERLQGERGDAQFDLAQVEFAGAGGVAPAEGGDAAPRPAVRPGERAGRGGQQDQALGR